MSNSGITETGWHISSPSGNRKKMRKGTHSCTECRRRKIRCIFPPGASTCSPCSNRGSQCTEQKDETNVIAEVERAALRVRVARLESLLEQNQSLQRETELSQSTLPWTTSPNGAETSDMGDPSDHRVPFVSVLNDAEMIWPQTSPAEATPRTQATYTPKSSAVSPIFPTTNPGLSLSQPSASNRRTKEICTTLRSALPKYDHLMAILSRNGGWWGSYQQKINISEKGVESLNEFATRFYTSESPIQLGTLVIAYARSTNGNRNLFTLVESLVISDPMYSSTVEGMECLILLAKSYTEIGQPRRAWFLWRQGLATAQLMGLGHKKSMSPAQQKVWWSIYHADRSCSMFLGLPYGINDAHYGLTMDTMKSEPGFFRQKLILSCALVAGKLIDRNMTPGSKLSLASSMALDEELDAIASSQPKDWWDVPTHIYVSGLELDELRERLLLQVYFWHVRMYLYLPFIIKSHMSFPSSTYNHSKLACEEAARQMLKRFILLREKVAQVCLFECRTTDFVGFIAAAILCICHSKENHDLSEMEEDWLLVESIRTYFQNEERENGSKICAQCYQALKLLSDAPDSDTANASTKIPIPYFGIVIRRHTKQTSTRPSSNAFATSATTSQETLTNPRLNDAPYLTDAQAKELDVLHWELNDVGSLAAENLYYGLDTAMLDLDQDWSMFLNAEEDFLGN